MNTQQSKDFAEELFGTWDSGIFEREDVEQVVDELRRLHSVNAELLEALDALVNGSGFAPAKNLEKARLAIAKAQE
jgi:hypothetical protein